MLKFDIHQNRIISYIENVKATESLLSSFIILNLIIELGFLLALYLPVKQAVRVDNSPFA